MVKFRNENFLRVLIPLKDDPPEIPNTIKVVDVHLTAEGTAKLGDKLSKYYVEGTTYRVLLIMGRFWLLDPKTNAAGIKEGVPYGLEITEYVTHYSI